MKILLACLMCLVMGAAQSFAISGGPPYPSSTNVVGTYAGVMDPTLTDAPTDCGLNSIGVFSVTVPRTGISSGTFVMFSQGRVFSGTIQGVADPNRASLKGVLNATFNFNVSQTSPTGVVTTTPVTASANGNLNSRITNSGDPTASTTSTRLKGSATISVDLGELNPDLSPLITCQLTLRVKGFKQLSGSTTTAPAG